MFIKQMGMETHSLSEVRGGAGSRRLRKTSALDDEWRREQRCAPALKVGLKWCERSNFGDYVSLI